MLTELQDYLRCGRPEYGFVRVKCNGCRHEHLVAFSCKRRGFCPSCGARRMIETSAHLVDHVFPEVPVRQWVLSFPWPLRRRIGAVKAVDGVSFDIARGKTVGLVGESGSGKSTTGRTILQLERVTSGSIRFAGAELTEQSGAALRRIRSRMHKKLRDLLVKAGRKKAGDMSDELRQAMAEITKTIAEHADEFTDEELERLVKATEDAHPAT